MTVERSRWRMVATILAVCSLALLALIPNGSLAKSIPPPVGHAQVIAQGVDLMPSVRVAWRVTASEAAPVDDAEFFARTLGFAIGQDDPFLVTDGMSGAHTLLNGGQAAFHAEGASERRSSTSNAGVNYLNIELIVADAVDTEESLGSSNLVAASEEFRAPRGNRELRLSRDILAAAEAGAFEATSDSPYLLYVAEGAVEVTDDDGSTEIAAGDAAEFEGDIEILAGARDGATWMIASIGDEVELPPAPTPIPAESGTLEIRLEACPGSLDAECSPTTNADVTVPVFLLVDGDDVIIPDRATVSEDGTVYTWVDLPAGKYVTDSNGEALPGINIDGATYDDDLVGWAFTVDPGKTTILTLQVVVAGDPDTGSFLVTLYDCPAGSEPWNDTSPCDLSTEPWDVSVAEVGQSTSTEWTLFGDAVDLGGSQYLFEELPATSLHLSHDEDGPPGPIEVAVYGDPYFVPDVFLVDIPAGGQAEGELYRVRPGEDVPTEEPVGTGSLVVTQIDCPFGTDPLVDSSACAASTDPWAVTATNGDTGESWDLFGEGTATGAGTWQLDGLSEGTYSLAIDSNENWSLVYDADVTVGSNGVNGIPIVADQVYSITIYSVDLRAP